MLRKKFLFGTLAVVLSFGIAGTAFASDADMISANDVGTEAGNWQYNFEDSGTLASPMASSHNQSQEALTAIGSEAGNWQFSFESPETKADKAAQRYDYNPDSLSAIGNEGGILDNSLEDQMRTRCSDC